MGERAVLRLLDKSQEALELGIGGHVRRNTCNALRTLVQQPHGIILVTGPTGSGKTTTLVRCDYKHCDATRSNIMTVEDPIEYELGWCGPNPSESQNRFGLSPKPCVAILRQDPDVIMIGEIRDHLKLAQIAIQASLTGHPVLATLHTNDASQGRHPFASTWASSPSCSAHRCSVCWPNAWCASAAPHCAGQGCDACGHSGYQGRTGIFELLTTNDEIRALIHAQASEAQLREAALLNGMTLMREDGERLVRLGILTEEELIRVTRD
jgi:general secretion pathway protein E